MWTAKYGFRRVPLSVQLKIDFFDSPTLIELGYPWTTISGSFISQVCGQWKAPWDNNEERKVGYILNNVS